MTGSIYILAGIYNLSILIFPQAKLELYDPILFNWHGIISILLFGLAYASIYNKYVSVPSLNIVFAMVKFYYFYKWFIWIDYGTSIQRVYQDDPFTSLFFACYGIGDLLFGFFFLYNALLNNNKEKLN
jgi:hypothetical protein